MTVTRLRDEMDHSELIMWWEYYKQHPFGDMRADIRQAHTSLILARAHLKEGHKAKLEDFILDKPEKKPMTEEQAGDCMEAWALSLLSMYEVK